MKNSQKLCEVRVFETLSRCRDASCHLISLATISRLASCLFSLFLGKGTNPLDAFALSRVAVSLAPLVIVAWCKSKILRKILHILITYTSLDNMCLLAFDLLANQG